MKYLVVALGLLVLVARAGRGADLPETNGEPADAGGGTMRFRAQGEFRSTPQAARESALQSGQEQMRAWLAKQDPPVRRAPSLDVINRHMVRQQEPMQEESVAGSKMYKATLVLDLGPAQVRDLRERDRAFSGLWTMGGVLAIFGVVALFFRIDEWTKGFLTRWLIAGAVALSAGLVGVWWFAH